MLALSQFIATLSCILFAGAAVYINAVEHPARMSCDTLVAWLQWGPSYKRATVMQASLAIASVVCGVLAWTLGGGALWLLGALLIGAVIPFTFMVIMPTNHKLLAHGRDPAAPETRQLLEEWGRLHAVRSALSMAASGVYLSLLLLS